MSDSSRSSMPILCHCREIVVHGTTWKENPGRRYVGCVNFPNPGHCRFFRWTDPPICERAKQIIPGLLRRLDERAAKPNHDMLAIENDELKQEVVRLKEKMKKMKQSNKNFTHKLYKIIFVLVIAHLVTYWLH